MTDHLPIIISIDEKKKQNINTKHEEKHENFTNAKISITTFFSLKELNYSGI